MLVISVPACSPDKPSAPPGIFFPRVPTRDVYPSALMEGVLEERAGCLFVTSDQDHWLVLWPEGYTARAAEGQLDVLDESGEVVGRVGKPLRVVGGETNPIEVGGAAEAERWASELTGRDIPERCGDLYWIVSP